MNRKGFTGLEVLGVIFAISLGFNLAVRLLIPKKVQRDHKCSVAGKTLRACQEIKKNEDS